MYFNTNSSEEDIINLRDIHNIWKSESSNNYYIKWSDKKNIFYKTRYETKEQRNLDFKRIKSKLSESKKGELPMINKIKELFKKHEDVLFPLLMVIALDFFFNDGRFQKKIMSTVHSILDKVTERFEGEPKELKKDEINASK